MLRQKIKMETEAEELLGCLFFKKKINVFIKIYNKESRLKVPPWETVILERNS